MSSSTQRMRAHVAACMVLGAGLIGDVHGAIVHSGPIIRPIPPNIQGMSLNLVTGSTDGGSDWDFGAYSSAEASNSLYLSGNAVVDNGYLSTGGTILGPYRLQAGTLIGAPAATFFQPVFAYDVGDELNLDSSDNLIGVSFRNEDVGGTNFGWVRIEVGGSVQLRTVVEYAYETTVGTPIVAGATGINSPPTISATSFYTLEGRPPITRTIGNAGDLEDPAPIVTVDGGTSSTQNGVTIESLVVDPATDVLTASVGAACGATAASFTLRVTDSDNGFADTTLDVSIAGNHPPALVYPAVGVVTGGSRAVAPTYGPADSDPVVSVALLDAGTFAGSVGVDNVSGIVALGNAQPPGEHTLQIRTTDSCGAANDVPLAVTVGAGVDLAITKTADLSGRTDGVLGYTITVTNPGTSAADGVLVTDQFASPQTGAAWTCSATAGGSCGASGSGDINDMANVPPGGAVTYLALVDVPMPQMAAFDNTATVAPPAGLVDTNPTNNTATVTVDTIGPFADGFESLSP